jgi:hypothetical protein
MYQLLDEIVEVGYAICVSLACFFSSVKYRGACVILLNGWRYDV